MDYKKKYLKYKKKYLELNQKGGFDCDIHFNNTIGTCWLSSSLMVLINNDESLTKLKANKIDYGNNNKLLYTLSENFFNRETKVLNE